MRHLHLRDINAEVVSALGAAFAGEAEVSVSRGDIFAVRADAIVSPGNSFGYMDGGIDLLFAQQFGLGIEARLRERLLDEHFGELPVGQALVLATGHPTIPYMVSAPTMRVPGTITRTVNVYLACRAALIAVMNHNTAHAENPIRTLLMPGLGTGVGEVHADRAARQMRLAYDTIVKGRYLRPRNAGQIWGEHHELLS